MGFHNTYTATKWNDFSSLKKNSEQINICNESQANQPILCENNARENQPYNKILSSNVKIVSVEYAINALIIHVLCHGLCGLPLSTCRRLSNRSQPIKTVQDPGELLQRVCSWGTYAHLRMMNARVSRNRKINVMLIMLMVVRELSNLMYSQRSDSHGVINQALMSKPTGYSAELQRDITQTKCVTL